MNHLQHLEQKAIQAHRWTSFSPEKRGPQMIKDYGEELNSDLSELESKGVSSEDLEKYKSKYITLFTCYLNAKSNCFSSMITGPANFPVRKHEKTKRAEQKNYENFRQWREKAKKAIIKKLEPAKTFASELERYRSQLEDMKINHELMKEGNKLIKQALKDGVNIDDYLTQTFQIKPHMLEWIMKFGFGLSNNNANMKRVEQRIKELEAKEFNRTNTNANEFTFEGGTLVFNYELDRLQIFFNSRPSKDELNEWKSKGLNSFNWSPSNNCWQRKITPNAIWSTKRMLNLPL